MLVIENFSSYIFLRATALIESTFRLAAVRTGRVSGQGAQIWNTNKEHSLAAVHNRAT